MLRKGKLFLALFTFVVLCLSSAEIVRADPLITPVGTAEGGAIIASDLYNLVRFTLGNSYTNVSIDASLISPVAGRTGTAYLTNQVGPGTTPANELASTGFTFVQVFNLATVPYVNLFSGLSLGPGTYFVVFSSANTAADSFITSGIGSTYATAPGVSVGTPQISVAVNPAYPPASTFISRSPGGQFFTVDGTLAPTAVPEPATMLLLGTGLAGVAAKVQRRRKARRSEEA